MIANSTFRLLRYWPLPVGVLLAGLLIWLRPAREMSALLIGLVYLALCVQCWWLHRRTHQAPSENALLIAYASQGGQAHDIARRSYEQLNAAGVAAYCLPLSQINPTDLQSVERLLLIVSTYGEGEAPDNGARFERVLQAEQPSLTNLRFAVLALGDSQYPDFCAFGERLQRRLQALHAEVLFDLLPVDNLAAGTLRHWQQQLAHLSGNSDYVDWQPAHYHAWQLHQRTCLNPKSVSAPIYHLSLSCSAPANWQAGDIAEIGPRHSAHRVLECLAALKLNPNQRLSNGELLADAMSRRHLPEVLNGPLAEDADSLLERLTALPHREYSIASSPNNGRLDLLVREQHQADGRLGLGSGWLCQHAPVGELIDLRIRRNPGFHGPAQTTPLILVGSGSGLAGLRAHLQERAALPDSRNWLIFGERHCAQDALLDEELTTWQQSGHLTRLDRVYSRDAQPQRYVQDCLYNSLTTLHAWLDQGAAIYVCGSLEGMGRDVDNCLRQLLGDEQLAQLSQNGRYRRDVY